MKFATFNVKNLYPEREQTPELTQLYDEKISWTAEKIKNLDADYLALQEVGSEAGLAEVVKRSGIDYKIFMATPSKRGIANALLYKDIDAVCESMEKDRLSLPVFKVGAVDTLSEGLGINRAFVYAISKFAGRPLHIFSVHLKSGFETPLKDGEKELPFTSHLEVAYGLARSMIHRLAEAIELRKRIDDLIAKDPDAQVIVAGDFNDIEVAVSCIQGSWNLELPGYLERATNLLPPEERYTFLSNNSSCRHLDYILVTRNLFEKISSVVIDNNSLRNHVDLGIIMQPTVDSDHAPVSVIFKD